ncbi:peroxiredoxin-2F, mitochondrial-like [Abrus precatorius]|uniref:Glutaredoxin-dependent peroxiredoxin n=1 Tax=Abrus precatorius TaxID=3816 RepID=A0A8B8K3G5_ABRPR|nr:peroxiredoxin-2F, mitochondrial-like [Abrus precatorius]
MALTFLKRTMNSLCAVLGIGNSSSIHKVAPGTDILSIAPNLSLQKACTWDEAFNSNFSTTPLEDIFKDKKVVIFGILGAFTGICSDEHVPNYKNNIDKFKEKGIDSVICVAINDPYTMNEWAEKLQAKDAIEFYGDFNGRFHKSLKLVTDLSHALLGTRSERYSAYVVDGKIKALHVERDPTVVTVSDAQTILKEII